MADRPLRPATRRCLGEPLPHQLADRPRDPPEAPEHFLTRPCDPVGASGISPSFLGLFQSSGQVSHVLLTRSPLTHVTRRSSAFDLHVLGPPPAFVLSQDQTLRQNLQPAPPKRCRPSNQWCDTTRRRCRREFEVDRDTNPGRPGTGNGGRPKPATVVRSVLLKLFRVCPATTRDRQVDSPHWLFRPLSRFQGAPGDQRPPGTRQRARDESRQRRWCPQPVAAIRSDWTCRWAGAHATATISPGQGRLRHP